MVSTGKADQGSHITACRALTIWTLLKQIEFPEPVGPNQFHCQGDLEHALPWLAATSLAHLV